MTVYDIIKELGITEGYCSICGECDIETETQNQIKLYLNKFLSITLDENGKYLENGECVIFPSKDDRDWGKALKKKREQLLPENTMVMTSNNGSDWSLGYYGTFHRLCGITKENKETPWKYIVPASKFDFDADDLSINIKNSI